MSITTYADVNAGDSIVLFGDSQNAREALGWKTPIFRKEVGAEDSKRTFDAQNCYWLTGAIPRCHISATRQGDPCPAAQPGQQQQAPTAGLLAARAAGGATPLPRGALVRDGRSKPTPRLEMYGSKPTPWSRSTDG